jgi:hypothetical protein
MRLVKMGSLLLELGVLRMDSMQLLEEVQELASLALSGWRVMGVLELTVSSGHKVMIYEAQKENVGW